MSLQRSTALVIALATALVALPSALAAQVDSLRPDSARADATRLTAVVVTATRQPTPVTRTSQPVTVLSGTDLRARGVTSVADALREVPGVSIARTGSFGGVTSLFMRGGESRYTKVLVDGVPVNTVGGTVFLQNLTLDNVDRIEVVGGPASALYGADAMTGVVQIFTRRGAARGLDVSGDWGTYRTGDASASLRTGTSVADLAVGAGWHESDGVLPVNNAYTNGTGSVALTLRPDSATTIALTSRYSGAIYHFPTDFAGVIDNPTTYTGEHRALAGVDASHAATDWLTLRLLGGYTEVHSNTEDVRDALSDKSHDLRATAEARAELRLPASAIVTFGVPYESEMEALRSASKTNRTSPSVTRSRDRREMHGAYVAAQGAPTSWLAYDASARYDTHSDYRSIATYHAGASLALWPGGRLRAAYGTGFNAPAFYETLGSAYNLPNRDLQPEQVHSLDLGAEQSLADGRVRLHVGGFDQRFSQIIEYVLVPDVGPYSRAIYENATSARSLGYTGGTDVTLATGLDVGASYSQTIARLTSDIPGGSGTAGDALLRRASHTGEVRLSYARGGWAGGIVASYVGSRPDLDFQHNNARISLPAYTIVDLSAAAPLLERNGTTVAVTARVENALDRRYQEIANFASPRRTVLLGARLSRE